MDVNISIIPYPTLLHKVVLPPKCLRYHSFLSSSSVTCHHHYPEYCNIPKYVFLLASLKPTSCAATLTSRGLTSFPLQTSLWP